MISGQPDQQQVIDAFFKDYYKLLCNHAFRILKNSDDAEDAVIELLQKVLKDIPKFNSHPDQKAYLYKSIYNNCYNKLRKHKYLKLIYSEDEWLSDSVFSIKEWANMECIIEVLEYIHYEIAKLPPQQKRIITLVFDEDLSEKEIAEQTGLSRQVVKNYKNRAINKIKAALIKKGFLTVLLFSYLFSRN